LHRLCFIRLKGCREGAEDVEVSNLGMFESTVSVFFWTDSVRTSVISSRRQPIYHEMTAPTSTHSRPLVVDGSVYVEAQ
jgi:hypothetical protein